MFPLISTSCGATTICPGWHGVPKLGKDLVCLRPHLTSDRSDREARPTPEVEQMLPQGGAVQASHDHEVVGVVHQVPGGHILENPAIGP